MADAVEVEGKEYISSKHASHLTGYTQDYVGQLARAGHIEAKRISGLWYVSIASLEGYKSNAEKFKPTPPLKEIDSTDSLLSLDGRDYISTTRAAKITGYHPDYVGQLARSSTINSRQIGTRWYVDREQLIAHKAEKDALLAAVQTESVGLAHKVGDAEPEAVNDEHPHFTYVQEIVSTIPEVRAEKSNVTTVPIRVVEENGSHKTLSGIRVPPPTHRPQRKPAKSIFIATIATLGIAALGGGIAVYSGSLRTIGSSAIQVASAAGNSSIDGVGHFLELLLVRDVHFKRGK